MLDLKLPFMIQKGKVLHSYDRKTSYVRQGNELCKTRKQVKGWVVAWGSDGIYSLV